MNALQKARLELTQVENEQRRLAQRKSQLLQTIAALAPLVTEQPSREALSLADAIRTVIGSAGLAHPETIFTAKTVRTMLQEMGFDFSGYNDNHLAAIHTALRRMWKAGELQEAGDPSVGVGYRFKLDTTHPIYKLRNRAFYGEPPEPNFFESPNTGKKK